MKEESHISTTRLGRSLSSWIDQVQISGKELLISKGSRVVATLGPPPQTGISIKKLLTIIGERQPLKDSQSFLKDLKKIRQQAKLPKNPWD